jgi:hypothetical protein
LGKVLALPANIRQGSSLFCHSVVTKKKSFIMLTPGVNVIKPFSFIADDEAKLARVFITGNHFSV